MKIKFLGAAGMVTGSCYYVENSQGDAVLVDMGMFQGIAQVEKLNREPLDISLGKLKGVIITHAHLDHCGRLPLLVNMGYKSSVYMTAPTKEIAEIGLLDSAKLAEEDDEGNVLYTDDEVGIIMQQVETVEYEEKKDVGGFRFWLVDAGHILGAASVVLEDKNTGEILVMSGDLGNTPEELIQPTQNISKGDYVLMESTYGNRLHGENREREILIEEVQQAEKENGVVLIPSFSIQRSQDLLYIFDQLKKEGKVKNETKVYFDSPMAVRVTEVFRKYPEYYSERLKMQIAIDDPFEFPGLVVVRSSEDSKKIKDEDGVKVIIAGSGMMNGGRILHHALNYLGLATTRIIFVGYQGMGTLGRRILDGEERIRIYGQEIEMKAKVREITSMSAHADQKQLLDWLGKIQGVKKVILIHGDEDTRLVLEKLIKDKWGYKVFRPRLEEVIDLG